jgi:predicted MFS family arabinose efflux permease
VLAAGHLLLFAAVAAVADVGVGGGVAVLVPGLLLVGTGMGLVLAPLASIVLASLAPERVGAASGVMTTVQNVGNALGVAALTRLLPRTPSRP